MPHSSREAAIRAFTGGLQTAFTCLAHGKVEVSRRTFGGEVRCYGIFNRERPTRLSRDLPVWFLATHAFRPVQAGAPGAWTVVTAAYNYAFTLSEEGKHELLAFHWHSEDVGAFTAPHLHIGEGGLGADAVFSPRWHVPTARVGVDDVVRFAITQLGARPLRSDWGSVLARFRSEFGE